MRYCLRVEIIHKDSTKVKEVLDALPDTNDAKQWSAGHAKSEVMAGNDIIGEIGNFVGSSIIYFDSKADRDSYADIVKALVTKVAAFEVNTKIVQFDSSHYQDGKHIHSSSPCIITREDNITDKANGLEQKVI